MKDSVAVFLRQPHQTRFLSPPQVSFAIGLRRIVLTATLLHISDIHRTEDEQVGNAEILQWLSADLRQHALEGIPRPDIVIISGDLTQKADQAEYDEAAQLIGGICQELSLPMSRVVVVPGNHDIHWPTCEDKVRIRNLPRNAIERALAFCVGGQSYTYESEESFQARLQNFRKFYQDLFGKEYPAERAKAFTTHRFDELGLTVIGLSSVDLVDLDRPTAGFNPDSVRAASQEAQAEENAVLVVWHHDLDWERGGNDGLPADHLRLLSAGTFSLGLCGHTHRPASNSVCSIEGYPFPVVAAGSLCAGARQRPESRGCSYNVIRLENGQARVWVRTKPERGKGWRDCSEFGVPNSRVSWFDVALGRETSSTSACSAVRQIGELRAPNPFAGANAKQTRRLRVLDDYVWTKVADDASIELPQIVLGTRGSGKTALLFTQTIEGQLQRRASPDESLGVVGLFCQMRVNEVTAFNGKGAIPRETRKALFRAVISSMWAVELVDALTYYNRWARENGSSELPENKVVGALARAWGLQLVEHSFADLRVVSRKFRGEIMLCLSATGTSDFGTRLQALQAVPLLTAGLTSLGDAASVLQAWAPFENTRWSILFDEVEFLNEWQQECVYEHMTSPSGNTSCKIATLPYAHSKALNQFPSVLVLGDDYGELPVVLGEETEFEQVAKGLWQSRLAGREASTLEQVWPEEKYHLVIRRHLSNISCEEDVDDLLIGDLAVGRREKAEELRRTSPGQFGDQFRRKFQEPFRFRLANRASSDSIPLYWGYRQMLKACGKNPRQFLGLAEICWSNYWAVDGVRPLTAEEQYDALRQWAGAFSGRCKGLPNNGHDLKEIINRVAQKLRRSLYDTPFLRNEKVSIKIEDCHQDQAEAIAIGIAYGFLVPRLTGDTAGRLMFPSSDIVMRLGYPVAVANELPLRQGEVLKISTMRQLELSWWNE